jgi:hypothetical protein
VLFAPKDDHEQRPRWLGDARRFPERREGVGREREAVEGRDDVE